MAMASPQAVIRVERLSVHRPKVDTTKSYNPPIPAAKISGLAWLPPCSPDTSTCVVAVASGKGYSPCFSCTKNLRNGIRNRIPRHPPSRLERNTCMKFTVISGYLACRIYRAGRVKIAPATMTPLEAPILWMMTFSPKACLRLSAPDRPTAMMAIGIAASNTWPTFRPKYAAAAENRTAIITPVITL